MNIIHKYVLCSLIAIFFNLTSQEILLNFIDNEFKIFSSVMFGTCIGLLVKYILDKVYIFKYVVKGIKKNTKVFLIYTSSGIATTLIFWFFEFSFEFLFNTKFMRYIGALIGLSISYYIKYNLDRKFIFIK